MSLQLFILALDVLGHMLDNLKYTIRGLSLPSDIVTYNQSFTNNIAFFFERWARGGGGGVWGREFRGGKNYALTILQGHLGLN